MTKLKYLEDTYLFSSEAEILNLGENENGKYITLNETIFYPQGGGQPCDNGEIIIGDNVIEINNVRMGEDGVVLHYFEAPNPESVVLRGKTVKLKINEKRRIENAKNHSAGHLIDIAMKNIGLDYLAPTKGHHFPGECKVEYNGVLNEENNIIIENLENEIKKLILEDIKVIAEEKEDIKSPIGKKPRFVYFEGYDSYGCGCGGTHVSGTGKIGGIEIKKIKNKKGNIKVSYEVV